MHSGATLLDDMPSKELLHKLMRAEEPSRSLDREIALAVGFKHDTEQSPEAWISPHGERILKLPNFTGDAQDAYELARYLTESASGACSWEEGLSSAKIGSSPICQARSPARAICIAILVEKWRSDVG